ncbi:unnamed protein product [Penicillium salamii]|uniref:Uncharacterized protein n=1 Tax=Penicillium salamii TaxID=1612424 RepID=A0A9W4JXY6_9EURO|nr:unnamed protein product [Penicillium salamii]CAG7954352.1 unnamed protein product [Penicillium salamii]CAG7973471.1 unnamed protein product [Penicillium salamii]CAG8137248.1 unnamed protein product [Penicillium salamii]CAG8247869.1 unnamed protein product [Penicillium salamii]
MSSQPTEHDPSIVHELIAGAASYEAAQAYEQYEEANGKPESYEEARVIMAGIAGAFIDREVETRGFDFIDTEKAKRQARKNIDEVPPSSNGW